MKKIKAIIDLTRIDHGLMLGIAVLIGAFISAKGMPPAIKLFFAFLTAFFLEAGTFALNDYFDYEVDKRNKRLDRPLVRGDVMPRTALLIYFIASPLGVLFSIFVNETCFFIAFFNLIIATLYDVKLKEIKIIGNFYIAFIMAIPFIFGATAVSETVPSIVFFFAFLAFSAGVGREIMKDIMDFHGDRAKNIKSFPLYIGEKKSRIISSLFFIFPSIISFIPFFFKIDLAYFHDFIFLFLLIISDAIFIYTSYILLTRKNILACRKLSLLAIFFGLLAFLVGAFV
ncbi:MAG: prenyltransferase [Thermoplasmata archaeon]|nr:MAG: prenyltransferase [Thermoplasmata archaeon]